MGFFSRISLFCCLVYFFIECHSLGTDFGLVEILEKLSFPNDCDALANITIVVNGSNSPAFCSTNPNKEFFVVKMIVDEQSSSFGSALVLFNIPMNLGTLCSICDYGTATYTRYNGVLALSLNEQELDFQIASCQKGNAALIPPGPPKGQVTSVDEAAEIAKNFVQASYTGNCSLWISFVSEDFLFHNPYGSSETVNKSMLEGICQSFFHPKDKKCSWRDKHRTMDVIADKVIENGKSYFWVTLTGVSGTAVFGKQGQPCSAPFRETYVVRVREDGKVDKTEGAQDMGFKNVLRAKCAFYCF